MSGECKAGKSVAELCEAGDKLITEKLAKVYKGKKVEKGIAFPTCVSINNCCGHFSPLKEDSIELKDGDVCKMYVAFAASSTRLCALCVSRATRQCSSAGRCIPGQSRQHGSALVWAWGYIGRAWCCGRLGVGGSAEGWVWEEVREVGCGRRWWSRGHGMVRRHPCPGRAAVLQGSAVCGGCVGLLGVGAWHGLLGAALVLRLER